MARFKNVIAFIDHPNEFNGHSLNFICRLFDFNGHSCKFNDRLSTFNNYSLFYWLVSPSFPQIIWIYVVVSLTFDGLSSTFPILSSTFTLLSSTFMYLSSTFTYISFSRQKQTNYDKSQPSIRELNHTTLKTNYKHQRPFLATIESP
jgi:hypothetical protein